MNPFLIIAVAAGAFYVGRRMVAPPTEGEPLPLPPVPTPDSSTGEVATSEEGAENLALWDELEFDVDVFPPGTPKQSMQPPRSYDGVSLGPDCSAVAVGHGFWQKLNVMAPPLLDDGASVQEVWEQLAESLFQGVSLGSGGPRHAFFACLDDDAPAALLLVEEIINRIRFHSGPFFTAGAPVNFPAIPYEPGAGGTWVPRTGNVTVRGDGRGIGGSGFDTLMVEGGTVYEPSSAPAAPRGPRAYGARARSGKGCTSHGQCGPLESCENGECVNVLSARPRMPRMTDAVMYALRRRRR